MCACVCACECVRSLTDLLALLLTHTHTHTHSRILSICVLLQQLFAVTQVPGKILQYALDELSGKNHIARLKKHRIPSGVKDGEFQAFLESLKEQQQQQQEQQQLEQKQQQEQ